MSRDLKIAEEIDGILKLLRQKMKERGFSQVRVQAELKWKGSYISQLFKKNKAVRVEQILLILDVIDLPPLEFFNEYFRLREAQLNAYDLEQYPELAADEALIAGRSLRPPHAGPRGFFERFFRGFLEARTLLRAVACLLLEKNVFTLDELKAAIDKIKKGPAIHPPTWSDDA